MIRYLVQRRREVKNQMKKEADPLRLKQLDIKQLALKILANSMYGCLGFTNSRFCATFIASTVTRTVGITAGMDPGALHPAEHAEDGGERGVRGDLWRYGLDHGQHGRERLCRVSAAAALHVDACGSARR